MLNLFLLNVQVSILFDMRDTLFYIEQVHMHGIQYYITVIILKLKELLNYTIFC